MDGEQGIDSVGAADWLRQLPAGVIVVVGEQVRWANARALALLKARDAGELIGRGLQELVHPLDLARVLARARRALRGEGDNEPTTLRVRALDGSVRMLLLSSTPTRFGDEPAVLATFMDLGGRARMRDRLRQDEANFRRTMETMQDVFYRTDADGITRYVCPAVKRVLGYTAEEIIGLPASAFYPDPAEREPLLAAIRTQGFVHDFPGRMRRKDGSIIDISISTQALADERGQFAGVEGIWRDISERKRMERELERLARCDDLTGCASRRAILERAQVAIERAEAGMGTAALLLLDLDHFKAVNDRHGHAAGDAALCQFVTCVQGQLREGDGLGRLGGEEFVVVLDDADQAGAIAIAERIRAAVAAQAFTVADAATLRLTVSIGVTPLRVGDRSSREVLARADRALYEAKAAGRDCVRFMA